MCSILNTEGIVALDRLSDFIKNISHEAINVSKGTIVNFMKELDSKSKYIIENIKEKILNSELIHTDATTGRAENRNTCVRTYSTKNETLLVPTYGKGKKHIEETNILNRYTGKLVHDHETVMYNYGNEQNKKVKSKHLRQEEQRLINRLKKYKKNHIMFLYDFSVPFDNNLAERDLRHVKIKQKVSGHFNSMKGQKIYLNIKSIIGTLKKQGRNFYKEIFNIYENIPVVI